MEIVDTHCHIHEIVAEVHAADKSHSGGGSMHGRWLKADKTDPDQVIADAAADGVTRLICVGCTVADSALAVDFVQGRPQTWASIGIHPHEAKEYVGDADALVRFAQLATRQKVVAVGECGLDYYYGHSPKADQEKILRFQLELAIQHDLPLIFHVRDAFDDFWPVFDEYQRAASARSGRGVGDNSGRVGGLRGVVHSFSATRQELERVLERGLYVGLNGIMTFSKDPAQLAAAKAVPLDRLLIETDAPFLTPAPYRGTICEPKHAAVNLSFIAHLQGKTDQEVAKASTDNARRLFDL
jgi:TatD DNase family protein